ncbi:ubiquitin carboxyl-terminal hydrolase 34-like [Ctenocephalides felis]|uniref:ubiquitin carboxyl-terminal hydrolase 34-like n=1 Tax=Ctenocephalides felis TaxID=7515 RepID=UPI000E6E3224|nr:ubiquitin carboxyl-terminal hydrolase 34-like [Ctenocephalides felis]
MAAEFCPHSALEWLAVQAPRNKMAHAWVFTKCRLLAAAYLLVSLVPHLPFRQAYHGTRIASTAATVATTVAQQQLQQQAIRELPSEATAVQRQVLGLLLRLLRPARHYADVPSHGTLKLTSYFTLMTYFASGRTEKLMVGPHIRALWDLFHPRLSEPSVAAHHNKQALLVFWHHITVDCPENAQIVVQNVDITRNIAFNYILADHDDHDVVMFNRSMLPAYYGLLRMCCEQSRKLTRQLAAHQNLQWAFKNITPHPTQYTAAVEELFKLMALFGARSPEATEGELREVTAFRRGTLAAYLAGLDARGSWGTLNTALRTLADTDEEKLYVLQSGGLSLVLDALHNLHVMYHEATACHVSEDLTELLTETFGLINCLRRHKDHRECRATLVTCNKPLVDLTRRLATLLNTFNPPEMRQVSIEMLCELMHLLPDETRTVLLQLLSHSHNSFHTNGTSSSSCNERPAASGSGSSSSNAFPLGPYFPRRGSRGGLLQHAHGKNSPRPPRPVLQMYVPHTQIQSPKGVDVEYDAALASFYRPYHEFVDQMLRGVPGRNLTINSHAEHVITLSAMTGYEAAPLHFNYFPALWIDALEAHNNNEEGLLAMIGGNAEMLADSIYLGEYVDCILLDERVSLTDPKIWEFMQTFFPKISIRVLTPQTCRLIENLCTTLSDNVSRVDLQTGARRLRGDVRALHLVLKYNQLVLLIIGVCKPHQVCRMLSKD